MSDPSEDEGDERVARLPGRPPKNQPSQVVKELSSTAAARGLENNRSPTPASVAEGDSIDNLRADLCLLNRRISNLEAQVRTLQRSRTPA